MGPRVSWLVCDFQIHAGVGVAGETPDAFRRAFVQLPSRPSERMLITSLLLRYSGRFQNQKICLLRGALPGVGLLSSSTGDWPCGKGREVRCAGLRQARALVHTALGTGRSTFVLFTCACFEARTLLARVRLNWLPAQLDLG